MYYMYSEACTKYNKIMSSGEREQTRKIEVTDKKKKDRRTLQTWVINVP